MLAEASASGRLYPLRSQMRIAADKDYVGYVRAVLSDEPPQHREDFGGYDLRFFDDPGALRRAVVQRDREHGLSRLVAGYAWKWVTKTDKDYDTTSGRIVFDRAHSFDKKGRENNKKLGITYSDEDLLAYVRNIYTVLLTRGIRGTYVYVCDEALREHLARYF
ncbi:DUF2075 domain-containing protein [Rathayibacter sp. PhB152]|uniref:DUF2075 domain-containing protein n=1 Tax=Rathayibacter sp. PhB152 TaxID=2485190 RepID=UPI0021A49E89|nr:DUF2075 domain-containing protein [Rathayibacter sp. PhB152]